MNQQGLFQSNAFAFLNIGLAHLGAVLKQIFHQQIIAIHKRMLKIG